MPKPDNLMIAAEGIEGAATRGGRRRLPSVDAATAGGSAPRLDDLPDGVVVADASGRVAQVNAAAARVVGVDAAALVGKDLDDALPLSEPSGRRWWPYVDPYRGLRTVTGHRERLLLLPDEREVLVTARYVRDVPLGPVTAVVVGLRDARARAREDSNRAELVSMVAHELRSPLTSVKGFTATLLAKWERFTDDQRRPALAPRVHPRQPTRRRPRHGDHEDVHPSRGPEGCRTS